MCLKIWRVFNNLVAQPSLKMSTGYPLKCFFPKNALKTTFLGILDNSEHFCFFSPKIVSGLEKISEFMHILCFPENELIASILLWDGCNWFTEYGR